MKKQLLVGSALLAAVGAYSQANKTRPVSALNMAERIAQKFAVLDNAANQGKSVKLNTSPATTNPEALKQESAATLPPSQINWKLLCGSANTYGMLVSQSRPLQYNDNVNAVSFIHRKSATYTASSNSNSGTIVAEISSDWGANWDSTCLYANGTDAGRYPQGAIYSAPGNTSIANAYVVGCGPTVAGSAFSGNWYASKQLGVAGSTVYNTTADATPNAQQFITFNPPQTNTAQALHGWSRHGFSSTDDGVVRSLALIQGDNQTLGGAAKMRGVAVVKGVYSAGVFNWTTDTLIPTVVMQSNGEPQILSSVQMAWNEAGTTGYVVILGALQSATGSNRGFQPIVFKTTNSGSSWAQIPGIDFNAPAMQAPVLDHLAATGSGTVVPFVDDFDMVVDGDGKLHIASTLMSTFSTHDDSLGFIGQFTMSVNPGEQYKWGHTPGNRPYLHDFIGDGTGPWMVKTIDSLSTEGPSPSNGGDGFNDNPWDPTGTNGAKLSIDSRIQAGRTPDGKYLTFSYAESDTAFTNGQKKWNNIPDIKARLMSIGSGTNMYVVSPTKINVSKPAVGQGTINPEVATRASLHYMSPTTGSATVFAGTSTVTPTYTVDINTPFTVTNSNPYSQLTNNTTWYSQARLSYAFTGTAVATGTTSGVKDNSADLSSTVLYPNPTKGSSTLAVKLTSNQNIDVTIYNMIGQSVKTVKFNGQVGDNQIALDLNNLSQGVYMVNVKIGNSTNTKKLIIE